MGDTERGRESAGRRGQTTLDFSVGVSIFLTVVVFTVAFVPSMFAPFDSDTGQDSTTADRVADRLARDLLIDAPLTPGVLNDTCTAGFFDADGTVPTGCSYAADASALRSVVGVDAPTQVNVTVRNGSGVRTVGGTRLAAGEAPNSVADPVVASRSVLLDGRQSRLLVRVW
jgi:hypothetical protein